MHTDRKLAELAALGNRDKEGEFYLLLANGNFCPGENLYEHVLYLNSYVNGWTGTGSSIRVHDKFFQEAAANPQLFDWIVTLNDLFEETGVLFWDTIQKMANSNLFGYPVTNMDINLGVPLDDYGHYPSGAMNLVVYVENPYTPMAYFRYKDFEDDVALAVEFLDNLLSLEMKNYKKGSYSPVLKSMQSLRRISLGVVGLGDALVMLGEPYGDSVETLGRIIAIMRSLRDAAYQASINLAKEKGPAPAWLFADRQDALSKGFYKTLPLYLRYQIGVYGTRNTTLLDVPSNRKISQVLGVSPGIEPAKGQATIPDEWITIQAAVQELVDGGVTRTIFLPKSAMVRDVSLLYIEGWKVGLKSLTLKKEP
jgi:ribonucleoside-diphosphate reductase alpha chain